MENSDKNFNNKKIPEHSELERPSSIEEKIGFIGSDFRGIRDHSELFFKVFLGYTYEDYNDKFPKFLENDIRIIRDRLVHLKEKTQLISDHRRSLREIHEANIALVEEIINKFILLGNDLKSLFEKFEMCDKHGIIYSMTGRVEEIRATLKAYLKDVTLLLDKFNVDSYK